MMFTTKDYELLAQKGISEETVLEQLQRFKEGFPYLKLYAPATLDNGVMPVSKAEQESALKAWEAFSKSGKKIVKFVPASGAASRMFKNLFAFIDAQYDVPTTAYERTFFDNIKDFAFYDDLNACCMKLYEEDIPQLISENKYKQVVSALLDDNGLAYGSLPKGLLKFHRYANGNRTPMEEHLVEGALYAINGDGKVHIHFTVSPQHRKKFEEAVAEKKGSFETKYGVSYDISFSEQKSSTDTIAADLENAPFRKENGELLFRPSGHGALIANLNELDADIVFIKNIDNVTSDKMKDDTVLYKKVLAGILVELQQKAFAYLELLDRGKYTHDQIIEILQFLQKQLCCKNPDTKNLEDAELVIYLKNKLNRPIRVCGMVKNIGEPGGGPFKVYNPDGTVSLQILESSQIDKKDAASKEMLEQSAYFNPVDLVCSIKDFNGNKFNLPDYVDKNTGFISEKSSNGKALKALELPGLWNGSMSNWNSVFVEVPLSTFNPVKEVNDLLREQHQ